MPNLRLTDQEAADITSFLLESRNKEFEAVKLPEVKDDQVDALALDYLSRQMRHAEAKEKLNDTELKRLEDFIDEFTNKAPEPNTP